MISVIITMTLIWLLLCFASVVTLKQYAQKNLELTGATMSHSLEASLVFNDSLAANETLAALGKLVEEGKIRHIGLSNESSWGVCEFVKQSERLGLPRIATVQNLYNLTARAFETSLLDETCYREQVSLLAYSPLAFGQLTAKYVDNPRAHGRLTIFPPTWSPRDLRPAVLEAAGEYAKLARANGMTPTQLALAWCYTRWFVASTLVGATSLAQLKENIDAYTAHLAPDLVAAIDAIHARITNPGQ